MADDRSERRRAVTLGVSLKLYLDIPSSVRWARAVATIARGHRAVRDGAVRLFVLPSLPAIPGVQDALTGTAVDVGAQDLHWADRGAFTGAVSGTDLAEWGCRLVEVGHAERRTVFGEDDTVVRRKLAAAVRNGLIPVLCVGETETVSVEQAAATCLAQLRSALTDLAAAERTDLIVAYEPAWAIGGRDAAPTSHVTAVVDALRGFLADDPRIADGSVIYGGSAQRGTLSELGPAVDGLFLGRFAHDPADLARIIDEAAALRPLSRR